jgi:hypothetical protein
MTTKMFINDYLEKFGDKTFKELPFSEVDAAICGVLSYADYLASSLLKDKDLWNDKIPLSLFNKHETIKLLSRRYLTGPIVYYNFFKIVLKSKRYEELRFTKMENHFDPVNNAQYFSMVYEFKDRKIIVYRGTDNSIPGWKEDFLTAIEPEIPSQRYALEYLNKVLKEDKYPNYYVLGHSKGGNLAYFAFLNASEENKNRIKFVYNFDGNGFKNDSYDYHPYKNKIMKMVPSDDLVGCLFDTFNFKYIVASNSFSVWAHDMLSWKIDLKTKNSFKRVANLTRYSKAYQIALNYWVDNLSKEDLFDFIDFIFSLVDLEKPRTLKDLTNSFAKNQRIYFKSIEGFPKEKKKRLRRMTRNYINDFIYAYFDLSIKRFKKPFEEFNHKILEEK